MSQNKIKLISKKYGNAIAWNDADYIIQPMANGKRVWCPFYKKWMSMISRAYSPKYHAKQPTYIGVIVCAEWLQFSVFKAWMEQQDWQGKELDKDLIHPMNKVYSPESCCFVSPALNCLMTNTGVSKSGIPHGVRIDAYNGKFVAQCNVNGIKTHIGSFAVLDDAKSAYIKFKQKIIRDIAEPMDDSPLKRGLLFHALML